MVPQNKRKSSPPGQLVDIGGFRLHALVSGQGTSAVLLEPALGGFALQYNHIQSAVSAFTRVMSYDRAGQGWSECSPSARTPANLAGELKTLLGKIDVQPPYVLVGHSFGGLVARIFAGIYPDEVAGMVLVDSTHVDEYASFSDVDKFVSQAAMGVRLMKIASRLGLGRQMAKLSLGSISKSLSPEDLNTFITVASQPKHHEAMLAEFTQHRLYFGSHSEVPATLGDTPLIVVTAGNSVSGPGKMGGLTSEQVNEQHQRLQKDLVRLSSQSEQIILPTATHFSIFTQHEHVDVVVDAIRRLVDKARIP